MERCTRVGPLTGQMDIAQWPHGKNKWRWPNKPRKLESPLLWFPKAIRRIEHYKTSRSHPICLSTMGRHFSDMPTVIIMRMSGYMRTIRMIWGNHWAHATRMAGPGDGTLPGEMSQSILKRIKLKSI